mmetsp:Transcript_576/g.647  ORF Transcript_576/g.647 Transcript_576/m.647 type:complete len:85 (-) Transcript_576:675-929(-)
MMYHPKSSSNIVFKNSLSNVVHNKDGSPAAKTTKRAVAKSFFGRSQATFRKESDEEAVVEEPSVTLTYSQTNIDDMKGFDCRSS